MDTRPRSMSSPSNTLLLHLKQKQEISVQRLRNRNVKSPPIHPAQIPTAANIKLSLTGMAI